MGHGTNLAMCLSFLFGTMWWEHLPSDEKIMMGLGYAAMVGVVASICGIFYDKGNEEYNDEWPKNSR